MSKATVYVFRDAECMAHGFTMHSRRFDSVEQAKEYAKQFRFAEVVKF